MISEPEVLDVREPPGKAMGKVAELWKPVEGTNKIMCTACARYCKIGENQVGLCGIRGVHEGKLWLYVYGRVITGHVDPIEKKPVSHYRAGSKIFSIATTGFWLPKVRIPISKCHISSNCPRTDQLFTRRRWLDSGGCGLRRASSDRASPGRRLSVLALNRPANPSTALNASRSTITWRVMCWSTTAATASSRIPSS